jgi:hypothetical protein
MLLWILVHCVVVVAALGLVRAADRHRNTAGRDPLLLMTLGLLGLVAAGTASVLVLIDAMAWLPAPWIILVAALWACIRHARRRPMAD